MEDIVLVTADSVRRDHADALEGLAPLGVEMGVTGSHYTRPSLASLLSASYRGIIMTEAVTSHRKGIVGGGENPGVRR